MSNLESAISRAASLVTVATLCYVFEVAAFTSGYFARIGSEYLHFFSMSDLFVSTLFLMPITIVTLVASLGSLWTYFTLAGNTEPGNFRPFAAAFFIFSLVGLLFTAPSESLTMKALGILGGGVYFFSCSGFYYWVVKKGMRGLLLPIAAFFGLSTTAVMFGIYVADMDFRYRKPSRIAIHNSSVEIRVIRSSAIGIFGLSCKDSNAVFINWDRVISITPSTNTDCRYDQTIPFSLYYLYF